MPGKCVHWKSLDKNWLHDQFSDPAVGDAIRNRTLTCSEPGCKHPLPDLWVCLHTDCGRVFCGRSAKAHGLAHYHAPGTSDHCVVLGLSACMLWCYACDQEITDAGAEAVFRTLDQVVPRDIPPAGVQESDDTPGQAGVVGLQNLGNTCYVNASLQGLLHCEPLVNFFINCPSFLPPKPAETQSLPARRKLVHSFNDTALAFYGDNLKRSVSPLEFVRAVFELNPTFRGNGQHDSQEFLGHTLELLHEELKTPTPPGAEPALTPHHARPAPDLDSPGAVVEEDKEGNPPPKTYHSIISDIFEGALLSEVTCSQCKKVSKTKESFRILPVSIPSNKQRQRIRREAKTEAATARGHVGCSRARKKGSLMSGVKKFFGFEKKASVHLRDCISAFCSLEDLTGADKYNCEHCKALHDSTKKLSVQRLPEVLCVHVKRFRYDGYFGAQFGSKVSEHVEFPLEDLDMAPFLQRSELTQDTVTKYDLIAVVNHQGGLGGGHYIGYARNFADGGGWYEFDDSATSSKTVEQIQQTEAYILFYKAQPASKREMERAKISGILEPSSSEPTVYISAYWMEKFRTLNVPGPVDNYAFVCHHGVANVPDQDRDKLVPIRRSAWQMLVDIHGGGPEITDLQPCPTCEQEAAELNRRRSHEQSLIQKYDRTYVDTGEAWFIIDKAWLTSWLAFVNDGGELPGPITNHTLLKPDGDAKAGLEKGRHYRGVNSSVWAIFDRMYGGGPAIPRQRLDIYSDPANLPSSTAS